MTRGGGEAWPCSLPIAFLKSRLRGAHPPAPENDGPASRCTTYPGVTREICERTAAAAVLEGSDCKPQSQYVLGLRAKNCRTEDVLDEEISVGTNSAGKVAYVGKWPPANIGLCTPHCSLLCTAADS